MEPHAFVRNVAAPALTGFSAGLAASAAWITASGGAYAPAVAWTAVAVLFTVLCIKAIQR